MERSGHVQPNLQEPLFFTRDGKAFAPVTYLELHVSACPREEGGPDFARKYGPKVLKAKGTFSHARGYDNIRYVDLPTTPEGLALADEILKVYGDDPTAQKRRGVFATRVLLRTHGARGKYEYILQQEPQFSASWFVARTTADAVAAHNAAVGAKPGVLSRADVEALVAGFCEALLASPPLSLEQFARDTAVCAVNRALQWRTVPSCFTDGTPRGLSLEDEIAVLRAALAAREKAQAEEYERCAACGTSETHPTATCQYYRTARAA